MYCNGFFDEDDDDYNKSGQCQYFLTSCSPNCPTAKTLKGSAMPITLLSYAVGLDFSHTTLSSVNPCGRR